MKIKLFNLLNLSQHEAVCSILKIDKLRIMLDCGINERYDFSIYKKHEKKIKKIDVILLSHAEVEYHGALPYLFNELGCQAEIYSTLPVSDLSLVNMFDFVLNRLHTTLPHDNNLYQKLYKNIADLYDKINKVKFQQHIVLDIKGKNLSFKPYHIGHTVGACAWCISTERRNIFYLITYNHIDEKILNGMNFLNFDEKSIDLLITNNNNITTDYRKIKEKENELKQYLEYAAKNNGSVILASASTSRMYELLLFVLNIWSNKGPWSGPLYLYHNFTGLLQLAHSQLEFMSDAMTDDFYTNGDNPFRHFVEQNRHEEKLLNADVKLCRSPNDVDLKTPGKLIITNMSNLFFGSGQELLDSVWNNPKNLLIMTERNMFYEKYIGLLKTQRAFSWRVDLLDASFFGGLIKKANEEKMAAETATDTRSVVTDQETMITEEDIQPINKTALQSSLFGTKGFPAFPFPESKIKGNEYGEAIPKNQFDAFKRHTDKIDPFAKESNVSANTYAAATKAKFEPYFFEEDIIVFPQVSPQSDPPKMRIVDMDLNGVSDGESMVKIINSLNPKSVIFVNGSAGDNTIMMDKLESTKGGKDILFSVHEANQQIDLVSSSVEIKISPEFISNFNFLRIAANGFEFDMTRIRGHEISVKTLHDKKEVEVGLVPSRMFTNEAESDKNFEAFGYLDLEKFRLALEQNNYNAYYKEKVLCVEGVFFVRKEGSRVVIEGRYCKEYMEIRNILYSMTRL